MPGRKTESAGPVSSPVVTEEQDEEITQPACMHHWVIELATGPISLGVCRNCQETREFQNYIDETTWVGSRRNNRKPPGEEDEDGNPKKDVIKGPDDDRYDEESSP